MHKLRMLAFASLTLLVSRVQAEPSGSARVLSANDSSASDLQPAPQLALAGTWAPTRDWILRTSDNICGLRDANQLTHPGQINFETCLQATPEMKRLRDQGIDPKSAEGIQLRSAGMSRVTSACERVRSAQGYCSVWKEIRHKDGRAITDLSSQVIAHY